MIVRKVLRSDDSVHVRLHELLDDWVRSGGMREKLSEMRGSERVHAKNSEKDKR